MDKSILRLILKDQLSHTISTLDDCNKSKDFILMCELWSDLTFVKHHKKKVAFMLSSMRHFAKELKETGYKIIYIDLDDKQNADSLTYEVKKVIEKHKIDQIILTCPSEYHTLQEIKKWKNKLKIPVEIREDNRFFISTNEFSKWAKDKQHLKMEYFYRDMRKRHNILMEHNKPIGGQWNFDIENRKSPKKGLNIPKPYSNKIDNITRKVLKIVEERFSDHFGDLYPFYFAVNRDQALNVLKLFLNERLPHFGDYQDAMLEGEPWMYHAHISFYLNCGLLLPFECIKAAEKVYYEKKAPLNAVEGFIRQIIGWREYIRGIYWVKMPNYVEENFFKAKRALPNFYWTGDTKMNCLHQCVLETKKHSYTHHIQRLMVLGNFSLIAGIDPKKVNEWFWIVYADAYEWVELPNVSGMILFADGGYLATKPYASGGSYINKMSNYCKNCSYKVTQKTGEDACPFNYLYWDFLNRNRSHLQHNHRMSMMYKTYDRMNKTKQLAIKTSAHNFLKKI